MVMPRFRRMRRVMRAPIVSYKHQNSENSTYVGGDANNNYILYSGVAQGTPSTPTNVPSGSKVASVVVTVNFISGDASTTGLYSWMIVKLRDGQEISDIAGTDASNWSNVGTSNMRNQIFHTEMGIFPTEDAGWIRYQKRIKIPSIYHRVREGDRLVLVWNSASAGPLSLGKRFKSFS